MQRLISGRISRSALACTTAFTLSFAAGVGSAAAADAPAAKPTDEVVITGSRIPKRDFTSPSPIVTVNSAAFQNRAGPEIEQTLNQLPQFHADVNSQIGQAGA